MFLYSDKTVLAIKKEGGVYGAYAAPNATLESDALEVFNLEHDNQQDSKDPENFPGSNVDKQAAYGTTRLCPISFSTYLKVKDEEFSETSGTPDKALLTMFDLFFQDDVVLKAADNDMTWTFADELNGNSVSMAIFEDGHLTKYNGVRGYGILKATPGERYIIDWMLQGRLEGHDSAALPTPNYWGDKYLYDKSHTAPAITNETLEYWEFIPGCSLQVNKSGNHKDGIGEIYINRFRPILKVTTSLNAEARIGGLDIGDAYSILIQSNSSVLPHFGFQEAGDDYVIAGTIKTRKLKIENAIKKADTEIIMSDVTGFKMTFTSIIA